jgi:hypothetical protein
LLPQLSGIPLQSTDSSSDTSRNINRLLPVGQNVSATIVAVSKDQVQPEIFRLKLEINNRLIQMGVFQALPVGQKININRQSDGQIQLTLTQAPPTKGSNTQNTQQQPLPRTPTIQPQQSKEQQILKLTLTTPENSAKLAIGDKLIAAVISSRPIYHSQIASSTQATGNPTTTSPTATTPSADSLIGTKSQQTTPTPPTNQKSEAPNTGNIANKATLVASNTASNNLSGAGGATQPPPPIQSQQTLTPATMTTAATKPLVNAEQLASAQAPHHSKTPASNQSLTSSPTIISKDLPTGQNTASSQTTQNGPSISRPAGPPSHHLINAALPNGSKIELASPQPLPQGTQIQIIKTSNQDVQVLQLKAPSFQPSSALERPAIQETLRNSLPAQIPTAAAFSQLTQVASQTEGAQAAQLTNAVKSLLQLFGVRPGSQEAPSQIKQNIERGGLGTENSLSKGIPPHPQDMKSQLQQLQKLADTLPPEQKERLEQLLQGVHSRVTSQQLNSLQQWRELPDGGFERVFQLDLPIKQGEKWDNLELRLSREGGSNAAGEMVSVWRVRLHFDLEEQGGVDAEIRLTDGHEISTLFWCENKETAARLRERSDEFSERLKLCGFDSTEVNWHEGVAPEQQQAVHKQLVDLHT